MNKCANNALASSSYLVLSQRNGDSGVPGWAEKSEPNFLDLAFEESDNDSEDEWEEVTCTAKNTTLDRPLTAATSGFTLPTRGKRSEFLTLEVIEDWQPSSLPSASHIGDRQTALLEGTDCRLAQGPADEEDDSFDADLQLEAELAEGLADLNTPVPGPSQQPRSCTPNVADRVTNLSPSTRPPLNLKLEVIEYPSPVRTSVEGKEKVVNQKPVERPHKLVKHADTPRASSVIKEPPTRKPKVSFQEKAVELARSKGRLLVPSKSLVSPNPVANLPFSTTGGSSSAPKNPPHPRTQAASDLPNSLFMPKSFSHHVQNLRERQTEASKRQSRGQHGGVITEHTGRDLADPVPASTPDVSRGAQPAQKRHVQRTAGGKRISKAQAHAEEVMKICRSTKSYIVDMAAIKRRDASTLPTTSPTARPSSIRSDKTVPVAAGQRISRVQPQASLPIPQLPSQLLSTPLGCIPRGLKFTKRQKTAPEPGEITAETVEIVGSPYQGIQGSRLASANRDNGPPTVDVSKRRRENSGREPEGSSPRKKPRLFRS